MDDFKNKPFTFDAYSSGYRISPTNGDITLTFKLDSEQQLNVSPMVLIKHGTRLRVTVEAIE